MWIFYPNETIFMYTQNTSIYIGTNNLIIDALDKQYKLLLRL
jgi:hypothetical protein